MMINENPKLTTVCICLSTLYCAVVAGKSINYFDTAVVAGKPIN